MRKFLINLAFSLMFLVGLPLMLVAVPGIAWIWLLATLFGDRRQR